MLEDIKLIEKRNNLKPKYHDEIRAALSGEADENIEK